jgi:hypothetical protein
MNAHVRHNPCHDTGTGAAGVSFKDYCETSFARRCDMVAYQRCFPDRVAQYLRATKLSAEEVGLMFGVTARCAQNWIDGLVAPRADKIALIALRDPEGFAKHFSEDAA